MTYSVEKMGLAQARATINKERVVSLCGGLGHSDRGSVGEAVRGANNKVVKTVFRVQVRQVWRGSRSDALEGFGVVVRGGGVTWGMVGGRRLSMSGLTTIAKLLTWESSVSSSAANKGRPNPLLQHASS